MDTTTATYNFVLGWILMITILALINKTRLGHVILYYSLLLCIFLVLVVEYKQIAPVLGSIKTIGEFNPDQVGE